jgi:hypothetical protein
MHTYIYIHTYTYMLIHTYIYAVFRTRNYTYAPGHPRMRVSTRLRTHPRARASAVPPRTTARAAPTTRRARPACGGAPPGPKRPAHTCTIEVTDAVFHAPMFALNLDAYWNACAPSHPRSTPAERARMCRRGCVGAQVGRPRTDAAHGRVCAAGLNRRSVHRCSQPRMDIDTCMHGLYIHCVCACSIDEWPYEETASHSRTCREFAHRQRPHTIARVRKNTHAYPFTYPDFAPIDIHICT